MEYLEFDLNEVVAKQVKEQIDGFKRTINTQNNKISELSNEISELSNENSYLKRSNKEAQNFIDVSKSIKLTYQSIEGKPNDNNGYSPLMKGEAQYNYICRLMDLYFNIIPGFEFVKGYRDCILWANLAISFYDNKKELFIILDLIDASYNKNLLSLTTMKSDISAFVMPRDYNKEIVEKILHYPDYQTNGAIWGVNEFWLRQKLSTKRPPYKLFFENKQILKSFNILIETIERKSSSQYHYLFRITEVVDLPKSKVKQLGHCLINIPENVRNYDDVKKFIKRHLSDFDDKTLNFLFKFITSDSYSSYSWINFPVKYQIKYLKTLSIDSLTQVLKNSKLDEGQKKQVLLSVLNPL